jgi:hypothetical protein
VEALALSVGFKRAREGIWSPSCLGLTHHRRTLASHRILNSTSRYHLWPFYLYAPSLAHLHLRPSVG